MPELNFQIESAAPVPYAAAPTLAFKLKIEQVPQRDDPVTEIQSIALRCQIRLEPMRRRYTPAEQERLFELFGEPQRWAQTLKSMLWMNTSLQVPPFSGSTSVDLTIPCTFDFNIATTKYFDALEDGQIPVCFLFSGTIFYRDPGGTLQVAQISWEKEADFTLPVHVWKQMIEMYFPNSAWMMLRKDVFDELVRFKLESQLPTLERAVEKLLENRNETVRSAPRTERRNCANASP